MFDSEALTGERLHAPLHGIGLFASLVRDDDMPIPTKPPLRSDLIAPPDSEMISPPGAGALLAV